MAVVRRRQRHVRTNSDRPTVRVKDGFYSTPHGLSTYTHATASKQTNEQFDLHM